MGCSAELSRVDTPVAVGVEELDEGCVPAFGLPLRGAAAWELVAVNIAIAVAVQLDKALLWACELLLGDPAVSVSVEFLGEVRARRGVLLSSAWTFQAHVARQADREADDQHHTRPDHGLLQEWAPLIVWNRRHPQRVKSTLVDGAEANCLAAPRSLRVVAFRAMTTARGPR